MKIIELEHVKAILEPGAHSHEAAFKAEIDAHWRGEMLANRKLYNGDTVLGRSWGIKAGTARIACRRIRYSTLVHWLKTPAADASDNNGSIHVFASGVMLGADGKIVMGRMAGHTLNSGRIYMPSGSLEPDDFSNGAADLDANMAREVREETGIDLAEGAALPGLQAVVGNGLFAVFRSFRFDVPAASLAARASQFVRAQKSGELAEILVVAPGEVRPEMPAHIRAFMGWLAEDKGGIRRGQADKG